MSTKCNLKRQAVGETGEPGRACKTDKRIIKFSGRCATHVCEMIGSYKELCEKIEFFYGIPWEEGTEYKVVCEGIEISTNFELSYVLELNKAAKIIKFMFLFFISI